MLVSDTTHKYSESMEHQTCEDAGCKDSIKHHQNPFFAHFKTIKTEYGSIERPTWLKRGYSVRRVIRGQGSIRNNAFCLDCPDTYKHLKYLDSNKIPLKPEIVVWQSKPVK
jgi:hypothetical protein